MQTIVVLCIAVVVLTGVASLRGAEYDEQYTLFLTAGTPRPSWPDTPFAASTITALQSGQSDLVSIATDLRRTDVHPPLYFWAISLWRAAIGTAPFDVRLFSVLCSLVSLAIVGAIARGCGIRPLPAMLLTMGSYGFAYPAVIARGFATAEALLLGGVWLLTVRRSATALLCAGALFGAAAGAAMRGWWLLPGAAPFLALDAWFFAAQHGARDGQFPPFSLLAALPRLAGYQAANVFGGLPLYADGGLRLLLGAVVAAVAVALGAAIIAARPWEEDARIRMIAAAAAAPPLGLLALGTAFENTPIELRYLTFGVPFIALLAAWACSRPAGWVRPLPWAIGAVQCAAITGLAVAAPTMQPARYAARAASGLAMPGTVALVPFGNDGVGIVGAFGNEAPASLPLLVVRPGDSAADLEARMNPFNRVILALLGQDRDSTAALPVMRQAVAGPGWRRIAAGSNMEAYERE